MSLIVIMENALSAITDFHDFLTEENRILKGMQTKLFMSMQQQKADLSARCEVAIKTLNQYKAANPTEEAPAELRKNLKEKWADLSKEMSQNAESLKYVQSITDGLITRVVNSARRIHNTHNAYANASRNHRSRMSEPLSIGIDQSL